MPRYRFKWANLSPALLKVLCRDLLGDLQSNPADALARNYGARPREDFVRTAWPILRESWLRVSKESRDWVVETLRQIRHEPEPLTRRDDQMDYLRNLRNSANLRRIVLQELVAAGEVERPAALEPRQTEKPSRTRSVSQQSSAENSTPRRGKTPQRSRKGSPVTTTVGATPTEGDLLTPGKVVRLRERLWRVDYCDGTTFGVTALDGRDTRPSRFHTALETVEAGELPFPQPGALADDRQQRLLLDAYKFSLLHGTAPILGLQRSRAIPTDYQLVPLLMALNSDPVRLLIADDVGTGKTVEAGLILSELLARGRARRILIAVPANLRDQWRDALDRMFHIDATIVAGHLLPALERRLLPGQSVWAAHDIVIASIDYLKTRTEEVLSYGWDCLIIDEAHIAAKPHTQAGRSTPDMERFLFASTAAARCRHLLLVTATPHNGYTDSFHSLFQMLDPTLVTDFAGLDRRRARDHHVVQRRRADIEEWYRLRGAKSPFPARRADEQLVSLTRKREMQALLAALNEYAGDLYTGGTRTVDRWLAAHLQKRLLSSPAALRSSIDKRIAAVTRGTSLETNATALERAAETTTDAMFDEDDEQDAAHVTATSGLDAATELRRLGEIRDLAKQVTAAKDPKLQALLTLLPERMAQHPNAPRVLVFTKYKDTLDYLVAHLEKAVGKPKAGLPADTEVLAIHGGMNLAQRNEVFTRFEKASPAVLIATDCISEGVNLQRACAELVHYELPWNPNRIEQRNGRIDRFLQREPFVGIRTLVLDDPLDASLLYLIVRKAEQMRADYGFVPPFLANTDILLHLSDPQAAFRGRVTARSSASQLSLADLFAQDAEEDMSSLDSELAELTAQSVDETDTLERVRDESFYGQTGIALQAIEEALSTSRDLAGTPEQVREFTLRSLRDRHATVSEDAAIFIAASAPANLTDLIPSGYRFTFDQTIGIDDPDIDVIDLAHPLLRRLIDMTLEEARMPECRGRVAARIIDTTTGRAVLLHALIRYVAHAEPPVLLEELVPIGYQLSTGDTLDAAPLLAAAAGAGSKHRDDVLEDTAHVLEDPQLRDRLHAVAAQRATTLAQRHSSLVATWANGLTQVEPTSTDLVAVTLLYPQVKP